MSFSIKIICINIGPEFQSCNRVHFFRTMVYFEKGKEKIQVH